MATAGVSCSICSDFYKNSDEIYSTDCGHVFHASCIREWRKMSLNCPVCRSYGSLGRKIYLNFEGGANAYEKKILELKSQQEQSVLMAKDLQERLDKSQQDFLNIQKNLSKYEERMKELNKQNDYLTLQNEGRFKDNELKTIEIHRLQEALNASSPEGSCMKLQEEINILKEKLQHMSLELTKEIRNSTELAVDKMKLQSMLEKAKKSIRIAVEKNQHNSELAQKAERTGKVVYIPFNQGAKNKGCNQSVVIKNVRGAFFDEICVVNYIGKLIRRINVNMSILDVQQISVLEGRNSETMSIIVKFKTMSSKVMFLTKSSNLRIYADSKDLVLHEYVDDHINCLFHQAKLLKTMGYKYVYCRNNKVYVRKDDKSVVKIVEKKEDIDELIRKAKRELKEPNLIELNSKHHGV